MKKYDFDTPTDRSGTSSTKWEEHRIYGDVIPMTVADMDFSAPPEVVEAIVERARHGVFGYTAIPDTYLDALRGWCSRRFGWEIKREWVRFSPGVIPALNFCVQAFTEPGDRVVIQPPVYYPFRYSISGNGREVLNNPLRYADGRYVMDLDHLRDSIDDRTRMIIISSPHNPVGRVWTEEELRELAGVCAEKDLVIISDEIHFDLMMPGFTHTPTAKLSDDTAARTVTCTSPSKTFNTAELQVANIIIPDKGFFDRFDATLNRAGLFRPNVLGSVACEAAYSRCEGWAAEMLEYIHGNYTLLAGHLSRELPRVALHPMEGTYLAWMDMREVAPEIELKEKLLSSGLALTPGSIFGPGGEGFFRMNLAYPRPVLAEALTRLSTAVKAF